VNVAIDNISIAVAVAILMTLAGTLMPTLRALRIDPIAAMRVASAYRVVVGAPSARGELVEPRAVVSSFDKLRTSEAPNQLLAGARRD